MENIVCYDSDGEILEYYTQWDTGQKLTIKGADMSTAPVFHFLNAYITTAYVSQSKISGGGITVDIPDILLQYDVPLIIYIQYDPGTTEYSIRIPIRPRVKPSDYVQSQPGTGGGGGSSSGTNITVVNNLTTNNTKAALSAAQGVVVKSLIDTLSEEKLDKTELNSSINTALALAKQSGDFKGEDGEAGRGIVSITRTGGTGYIFV